MDTQDLKLIQKTGCVLLTQAQDMTVAVKKGKMVQILSHLNNLIQVWGRGVLQKLPLVLWCLFKKLKAH